MLRTSTMIHGRSILQNIKISGYSRDSIDYIGDFVYRKNEFSRYSDEQ